MNDYIKWIDSILQNSKGIIPLESVINPYDQNILWYTIKGFNGYQLSNLGYIRSMKNFNKYPYGTLLKFQDTKNGRYYILSDNNNVRRKLLLSEIQQAVKDSNVQSCFGYQYASPIIRNQRKFLKFDYGNKDNIIKEATPIRKEKVFTPSFTVIRDNIIQPFIFIDNNKIN